MTQLQIGGLFPHDNRAIIFFQKTNHIIGYVLNIEFNGELLYKSLHPLFSQCELRNH